MKKLNNFTDAEKIEIFDEVWTESTDEDFLEGKGTRYALDKEGESK